MSELDSILKASGWTPEDVAAEEYTPTEGFLDQCRAEAMRQIDPMVCKLLKDSPDIERVYIAQYFDFDEMMFRVEVSDRFVEGRESMVFAVTSEARTQFFEAMEQDGWITEKGDDDE